MLTQHQHGFVNADPVVADVAVGTVSRDHDVMMA